jgi:hypothetical protein
MSSSKVSVSLAGALFVLLLLVHLSTAAFYHLDRFNRACIRNHGCDTDPIEMKMQVRHFFATFSGVARLFLVLHTKTGKINQMTAKYTNWP